MALKNCLVIGDINIDIVIHANQYPAEGGKARAEQADFRLGGSGCITAVCLQLLGQPTALAANIGEDVFSQFAREHLDASGLDTALVRNLASEQTGFFMTLVTAGDQRTVVSNRGANAIALNDEEEILSRLGEFIHLHVSGYSLLGNEQYAVIRRIMERAYSSGISISLDPGICTSEQEADRIFGLLKYVNYFLPSQEELASLIKEMELEEKIEMLLELGCKAVVLKQGSAGGTYYERGLDTRSQAENSPGKKIGDTTGAGDGFNAGILFGILNKKNPEEALELANKAAFNMITTQHGIVDLINKT